MAISFVLVCFYPLDARQLANDLMKIIIIKDSLTLLHHYVNASILSAAIPKFEGWFPGSRYLRELFVDTQNHPSLPLLG